MYSKTVKVDEANNGAIFNNKKNTKCLHKIKVYYTHISGAEII
jgi:hypothetical protein